MDDAIAAADDAARAHADARAMAGLVAVAQVLGEAVTDADVLRVVADHGVRLLGASGAALCLLTQTQDARTREGVRSLTTRFVGAPTREADAALPADTPLPMIDSAVGGRAHFLTDRASAVARFPGAEPFYRDARLEASASVPLRAHDALLGSLAVGFAEPHPWRRADRELLEAFAALTAQTLQRLRALRAERAANRAVSRFSETLQRSLLTSPPESDHLQITVRYLPAATGAHVGGDWYDAFRTEGGATSLVIGDVSGHDRDAAAVMGQLRNLLRGISCALDAAPAAVLRVLDRAMHDLSVDALATVVLARVEDDGDRDRPAQHVRWSNAGHPPPLLVGPDGSARFLETEPDLVVGLDPATARADHVVVLAPGATLLLYTDGLVERRDASLGAGLAWLAGAARDLAPLDPDALCDALLAQVGGRVEDDVALLALRVRVPAG